MMNNRKPKNRRGKLTRREYEQLVPEAEFITRRGQKIKNPDYPGMRRIVHEQTPKYAPGLWGKKD